MSIYRTALIGLLSGTKSHIADSRGVLRTTGTLTGPEEIKRESIETMMVMRTKIMTDRMKGESSIQIIIQRIIQDYIKHTNTLYMDS
jgi:hypothetical protein